MTNEASIQSNLRLSVGSLNYQSRPTQFYADVSAAKGPTPGNVLCALTGTNVDLSELTTPGLCRIMNLDSTNYVEVGIYDGASFYPLMELLPGESFVFRLARNLNEEYGTGTGTTGEGINTLQIKARTAACQVLVEAFEK